MLTDNFGRNHNYLRISLTDACNFRCTYCMPDEDISFMPHKDLMQPNEIFELARIFVALGVDKIRLTGGEPLLRKDFAQIVQLLATLPIELTLTTNAARLHLHLPALLAAKVKTINISLDTLQPARFLAITQRNEFAQVWANIKAALAAGLTVKLNAVLMRGHNDDEILDFVALTRDLNISVRFIEFMPFSGNAWADNQVIPAAEILAKIGETYPEIITLPLPPNATSRDYQITAYKGSFGIISSMSQHFCSTCNRLRLTADGKIKNCLFGAYELDILNPFRHGLDISELIKAAVQLKAATLGGQLDTNFHNIDPSQLDNRSMIKIGG
jgi:cyclic pyranopterin phosphate synthase